MQMSHTAHMWILFTLIALAVVSLIFIAWKMQRRALTAHAAARLRLSLSQAEAVPDPHRRILEAEKVIDQALRLLGFPGTFAEKLQRAGPRFSDIDSLWRAHKLRNRIAHEVGMTISEADVKHAMRAFEKALEDLC